MALKLYDLCVPAFGQVLGCQIGMLNKTMAFAESKRADPTPLLRRTIGKGELPLVEHALKPATIALEVCTRAANVTSPVRFDTSLPATFQRIAIYTAEVRNFMNAIPREKFSRAGEEMFPSPVQAGEQIDISLKELVLHILLPYALFSCAATYWILSGSGVPVSKVDYPFPPAW
jgi:hypothetical protein